MYCGAMSGLLKKKKNLGKPALLGWQTSDSQYSRGSAATDASDSVQCSLLDRKFKPGDAKDASLLFHFQDVVPQDKLKDDGSPCSHNSLTTDRKVYKISSYHQPMMREEQFNNCTSSGALYTVALHQRKAKKTKSSVCKKRKA